MLTHLHMVVYTWWSTLGRVGTFAKEKKLEDHLELASFGKKRFFGVLQTI